jgi:hypothetical protein
VIREDINKKIESRKQGLEAFQIYVEEQEQ